MFIQLGETLRLVLSIAGEWIGTLTGCNYFKSQGDSAVPRMSAVLDSILRFYLYHGEGSDWGNRPEVAE